MTTNNINPDLPGYLSAQRRKLGSENPEAFMRLYLPHHCKHPSSRMHQEVLHLLDSASQTRGARIVIAAPRSHGKTTVVCLASVLQSIVYKRETFIGLISNTAGQAIDLLTAVKNELEDNDFLGEDFPEVAELVDSEPGPDRWRENEIITRNGVRVAAYGSGMKIRGRKFRQHRPSLLIFDDIENEENVRSADQRERLFNWFTKAALKAGDAQTNIVVIGTILHHDSLLAHLQDPVRSPGWTTRKYQAVIKWAKPVELWQVWEGIYKPLLGREGGPALARAFFHANRQKMLEGTEVLWASQEDYYYLMELRLREGERSFSSEKQNEPWNPQECCFAEEHIKYWDDRFKSEEELLTHLGNRAVIVGAVDPSLGKESRKSDDSAILTAVLDKKTGDIYVIGADIERRLPDKTIGDIILLHKKWKYAWFAFEKNHFQEFMMSETIRRSRFIGCEVPIKPLQNTKDKSTRIALLQSKVKMGGILFCRSHRTLNDQLKQFPKGSHDDGLDALEMVVRTAEKSKVETLDPRVWEKVNRSERPVTDLRDLNWLLDGNSKLRFDDDFYDNTFGPGPFRM